MDLTPIAICSLGQRQEGSPGNGRQRLCDGIGHAAKPRWHTHICKYSTTIMDALELSAMAQTKMAECQTGAGRRPRAPHNAVPTHNITKQHKNAAAEATFAFAKGAEHQKGLLEASSANPWKDDAAPSTKT